MENADDGAAQAQQAGQTFDSDVSAAVICHFILLCQCAQQAITAVISATMTSDRKATETERDSMFHLYFQVYAEIEHEILQLQLHPGRGHAAFDIRAPNNPLPKLNVCHFYMLVSCSRHV